MILSRFMRAKKPEKPSDEKVRAVMREHEEAERRLKKALSRREGLFGEDLLEKKGDGE